MHSPAFPRDDTRPSARTTDHPDAAPAPAIPPPAGPGTPGGTGDGRGPRRGLLARVGGAVRAAHAAGVPL